VIVIVPLVVIGDEPTVIAPEYDPLLETPTELTVPVPADVQVGDPVEPDDVNTCPDVPVVAEDPNPQD
jgi:hypothetical protein